MQEQEKTTVELVDRQMMRLSGVHNVDIFDEEKIVLQTELGKLEIQGQHLNVINLDGGTRQLAGDGIIDGFFYVEEKKKKTKMKRRSNGVLSRLLS